jgi:phosphoglycolate phosphatase-like HAD superfamily hydrolase
MLRLITDFDGPIIDVSERYYRVYQLCLDKIKHPNQEVRSLPKDEFWQLKRLRIAEKQIAIMSGLDEDQSEAFSQLRKKTVHTQPYFEYDVLVPGAIDALSKLQFLGFDIAVMTMRRVRELDYAFEKYDLGHFFEKSRRYCLSNDYVKTRDVEDKPLLMTRAMEELPPAEDTWMVGDTEADIAAAKKYGIKMIAVESGIRSRSQLELYKPDYIVENLLAAVNLVVENS